MNEKPTPPAQESGESEWTLTGDLLFEIFCAVIFLGMIGLVFFNAFLRYVFRGSFPPSEEWARFLFVYITFFGAIEAFQRGKHIAVDLLIDKLHGVSRKAIEIFAAALGLFALGLLLAGGIILVIQTMELKSVATNVNMIFVNGTLPIMAAAAIVIRGREFIQLIRKPADSFGNKEEQ